MKRSSQPDPKKSKKVRTEVPKSREKLRIGNFYQEKAEKQLFSQWVDDDGHFGSSSLFKVTVLLIYKRNSFKIYYKLIIIFMELKLYRLCTPSFNLQFFIRKQRVNASFNH